MEHQRVRAHLSMVLWAHQPGRQAFTTGYGQLHSLLSFSLWKYVRLTREEILIRICFGFFCSLFWFRTLTGPLLVCCSFPTTTTLSSSTTTGSPALCAIRHPRTQLCALFVERSSVSRASAANNRVSASVCSWVLRLCWFAHHLWSGVYKYRTFQFFRV